MICQYKNVNWLILFQKKFILFSVVEVTFVQLPSGKGKHECLRLLYVNFPNNSTPHPNTITFTCCFAGIMRTPFWLDKEHIKPGFDAGFIYDWSSEDSLTTSYTQHHMLRLHLSQLIFNSFFQGFENNRGEPNLCRHSALVLKMTC